ncbi:MAG: asparagine synthase (glutamine-hydrolyzing) [Planctomycetota bacterium]|nr:asparagine synthase (glutamine-hydrolyzing) [Planctomycetota bacterium]
MCGIAGFVDPQHRLSEPELVVRAMSNTLSRRGPDDSGSWFDRRNGVAFGFRRLSIQDLSELGHQPMQSGSKRYTIVFNGEVYNFQTLRKELEGLGHSFRGGSDTEVMLAAFEQWGIRPALDRFNGMFAFAVWDAVEETLSLVRDRLGVKPCYWGFVGSGSSIFAFGSELKAIRAVPGCVAQVDRTALTQYIQFGYVPSPLSITVGIQKLQPGHILVHRPRTGDIRIDQWWSAKEAAERGAASLILDEQEALERVEETLRESIRMRLIADVPVGAFLSSGVDSSLVVGLASQISSTRLKTFSIGFEDAAYNEADQAKRIAAHFGTNHTELYVSANDAIAVVPALTEVFDEPFADSSAMPTYIVSKLARKQVTVALSGDGGDEFFGGYERYIFGDMLIRRFGWMPYPMRIAVATAVRAGNVPLLNSLLSGINKRLPGASRTLATDRIEKLLAIVSARNVGDFYPILASIIKHPMDYVIGGRQAVSPMTDPAWRPNIACDITRLMHADIVSYMPEEILNKVDRVTMTNSLESREPLVDYKLCELAFRIPAHMKIHGSRNKVILRRLLETMIPQEIIAKKKMGFGVPLDQWLRGPLRDWAEDQLSTKRLTNDGYLDPHAVRDLWEAHLSGARLAQWEVWTILSFQAWQSRWDHSLSEAELTQAPRVLPISIQQAIDPAKPEESTKPEIDPRGTATDTQGLHQPEGTEVSRQLASGTMWGLIQTGVQKGCSIGTYFVLAFLLSPEDLGMATLAISIATLLSVLYPGAAGDILIQRHLDGRKWEAACSRLASLSGLFILGAALLFGSTIAHWYEQPELRLLLGLAAGRLLLDAVAAIPLSIARSRLEFRYLSILETVGSIATLLATVVLAYLGFGALSVLIPLGAIGVLRLIVLLTHRPWRLFGHNVWAHTRELWPDFRAGAVQHYLNGVSQNIDYLALSLFHTEAMLGVYTIAYQMASMIGMVFSFTIASVAQPILSRLTDDPVNQVRVYLRTQSSAMAASMAGGMILAGVGTCAIRTLLPLNWSAASKPLLFLAIAFAIGNPIHIARAMLRANGRYSTSLWLQVATTGMLSTAVLLGSWWRGAGTVALGVLVTFAIMAPIHVYISLPEGRGRVRATARLFLRSPLSATAAFLPTIVLSIIIERHIFESLPPDAWLSLICLSIAATLGTSDYFRYLRQFDTVAHTDTMRAIAHLRGTLQPHAAAK